MTPFYSLWDKNQFDERQSEERGKGSNRSGDASAYANPQEKKILSVREGGKLEAVKEGQKRAGDGQV